MPWNHCSTMILVNDAKGLRKQPLHDVVLGVVRVRETGSQKIRGHLVLHLLSLMRMS